MLCSHVSKEPAGEKILKKLGLKPLITSELCLGEGTGGVLLLPLLDGALSVYHTAHKFSELELNL
jgi:nicotinate-nucleotide--dimethylbenzimidazole phosphoribosyltransferase